MRTQKVLLERVVFDRIDFNKMGLHQYARLDDVYVILQSHDRRYICEKKHGEYHVLGVYLANGKTSNPIEQKETEDPEGLVERIRESGLGA